MSKGKKTIYILVLAVIIIFSFGGAISQFLTDWWWFRNLELEQLFLKPLLVKLAAGAGAFLLTFLFLGGNLWAALRAKKENVLTIKPEEDKWKLFSERPLFKYAGLGSLIISLFVGLGISGSWELILKFFNQVKFGTEAPILGKDLSYYFFTLPFIQLILNWLLAMGFLALIAAVVIYFLQDNIEFSSFSLNTDKPARIHLSLLVSLLFFVFAGFTYFISIPQLLYSESGIVFGGGYTDINVLLPYFKILSLLLAGGGLLSLYNLFQKNIKLIVSLVFLALLTVLIGGNILPAIIQSLRVAPNELTKEKEYLKQNIESTRKAYGLSDIKKRELDSKKTKTGGLSFADIQKNEETINNIRIWERNPFLDTLGQLQEIRTYYDFVSADNGRYQLKNGYRQLLLSARELNSANLPQDNFINNHLIFTHGYGVSAAPVNKVTKEGLPELFLKDFPPQAKKKKLKVNRPEIYYGEKSNNYIFTNTKLKEFDYPSGEENVYTNYKGRGGVKVESSLKKALFSLRFGSLKVLLSNDITNQSRAHYVREIKKRARKAYPFLKFDQDPYLVIVDGKLKWILDAYTTSNRYPYSRPTPIKGGLNYIRNSVKLTIDAYSGKINAYIAEKEPVVETYQNIFPNAFKPLSEMPDELRKHIRYPEDLFSIQSFIYSTYHMKDPKVFYNKEDKWVIPSYRRQGQKREDPMMRRIIMKLPGRESEEFILMVPFTPQGKDNMAGWMAARSDGKNYGNLVVYTFSKRELVFGPAQINNRIDQNTKISEQISLWDQRGSRVIRGNLLVIPIEESLIYIQPLYLQGQGGTIPELKRVIVAHKDQIAMKPTLEGALTKLFGKSKAEDKEAIKTISDAKLNEAQNLYQQALKAQKEGNWASYGDLIERLGNILTE